jgi:hypothetical protein
VAVPDKPGISLTFKSLQTYSNGEVVRWIGATDADEPAPQVKLTSGTAEPAAAPAQPADADDNSDSGAPTWLAVLALVVGALGLIAPHRPVVLDERAKIMPIRS